MASCAFTPCSRRKQPGVAPVLGAAGRTSITFDLQDMSKVKRILSDEMSEKINERIDWLKAALVEISVIR